MTAAAVCGALLAARIFFTCCETAVTEISDSKVREYENENGGKKLLFRLLEKPAALMSAFSVHRTLNTVLTSVFCCLSFGGADNIPLTAAAALCTAAVLHTLGDELPRRLCLGADTDGFAVGCSYAVAALKAVMTPFTLISSAAVGIASAFGAGTDDTASVTEEEILMMVDAGKETGSIESSEQEMINNVFEFHEMTVSDVMTHRTDIVAVDIDAEISEVVLAAINSGFSRIPVYKGSIDHIEGIIYVKDLLCLIGSQTADGLSVSSFMRDAEYVPESCMCGDLFKKLTASRLQLAVAVDEYGGTAGLVTMEDLVEAIVGNIQDEYDNEAEEISKISDDTFIISGSADASDVMEELGHPLPEDNDYDTISGFVTDILGRIPEDGETPSAVYGNIEFTVLVTEDMRIHKIKAVIKNNEKEKSQNEDE